MMTDIDLSLPAVRDEIVRRYFAPKAQDAQHLPEIKIYEIANRSSDESDRKMLDAFMRGGYHRRIPDPTHAHEIYFGGAFLARWILDHPETVRGKKVVDVASGSGVVAIACAMAGAAESIAVDADRRAITLIEHNARLNGVAVKAVKANAAFGLEVYEGADVVTAADFYYHGGWAYECLDGVLLEQAKSGKLLLIASWYETPPQLSVEGEELSLPILNGRQPNVFRKISFPIAQA